MKIFFVVMCLTLGALLLLGGCSSVPAHFSKSPAQSEASTTSKPMVIKPSAEELEAQRHAKALEQLKFWMLAFEAYKNSAERGTISRFPASMSELKSQVSTRHEDVDPWGGQWRYRLVSFTKVENETFTWVDQGWAICSAGADRIFDTQDDIRAIKANNGWEAKSSAFVDKD